MVWPVLMGQRKGKIAGGFFGEIIYVGGVINTLPPLKLSCLRNKDGSSGPTVSLDSKVLGKLES